MPGLLYKIAIILTILARIGGKNELFHSDIELAPHLSELSFYLFMLSGRSRNILQKNHLRTMCLNFTSWMPETPPIAR